MKLVLIFACSLLLLLGGGLLAVDSHRKKQIDNEGWAAVNKRLDCARVIVDNISPVECDRDADQMWAKYKQDLADYYGK